MRNQFHSLSLDELARTCAASPVLFDAIGAERPVAFLYFKDTTGETSRREGLPLDVFSTGSKMSVFVEHEDGTKKSYNVRNILRVKFADED